MDMDGVGVVLGVMHVPADHVGRVCKGLSKEHEVGLRLVGGAIGGRDDAGIALLPTLAWREADGVGIAGQPVIVYELTTEHDSDCQEPVSGYTLHHLHLRITAFIICRCSWPLPPSASRVSGRRHRE